MQNRGRGHHLDSAAVLIELGLSKLWDDHPERYWKIVRHVLPPAVAVMAPNAAYGNDRMPEHGGLIVASNHFGTIDPPLIGSHSKRTIYFMTKLELLEMPFIGELLRFSGAFSVRRGEGDRDAIRMARWLLQQGHVLGMFMEGTRQDLGYPGPVHPGGAMFAIQEGVPVMPCGLDTFQWRVIGNRRRCCVVWGEPIDLSHLPRRSAGYREGAAILEREIRRLWREAAQAVVDGFPDALADGTPRTDWVRSWHAFDDATLEPWPEEPWAAHSMGPLFKTE